MTPLAVTGYVSLMDRPFTLDPGSEHGDGVECASSTAAAVEPRNGRGSVLARLAYACPSRSTGSFWAALASGVNGDQ